MEKIIFFGTSEFGLPTLEKLQSVGFEIAAVVTQPDKPVGRKQELLPCPVKAWALGKGVKVFQPETLEAETLKQELKTLGPDVFIVAAYGKLIPNEIITLPKFGTLNIHPSLLPKYRGPAPIHAAILNGDKETGVTIIEVDAEMDHGPIVAQKTFSIGEEDYYYAELHDLLAELGAELLAEVLPKFLSKKVKPREQDHAEASFVEMIKKEDARINWTKSAREIDRLVRAYHLWPVAWTTFVGKRLKIFASKPKQSETVSDKAGEIIIDDGKVYVSCGNGTLEIDELQLEGGKKLTAKEFVHGKQNLENNFFK